MNMSSNTYFVNGKVCDVDNGRFVDSFSISDGRCVALGGRDIVLGDVKDGDRIVDLQGRTVLPGIVDAHQHIGNSLFFLGMAEDVHTPPCSSIEEVVRTLRASGRRFGEEGWIVGAGNMLQETRFAERRMANRSDLDRVSLDEPVVMFHGMHTQVLNSRAIEMLGLAASSAPPGGTVEVDSAGVPNGVIREMHRMLPVPSPSDLEMQEAIGAVFREWFLKQGVTTVCELSEGYSELGALDRVVNDGGLVPRIKLYLTIPNTLSVEQFLASDSIADLYQGPLPVGGVKIFADGGASSEHAAVHQEYRDPEKGRGELNYEHAVLVDVVMHAQSLGMQALIHCAGDRAQDTTLDVFEEVRSRIGRKIGAPHRIEHMCNIFGSAERLRRAAQLDVLPVPNAGFIDAISDGMFTSYDHMGDIQAYNLRDVLDVVGLVATGSDSTGSHPENIDPLHSIQCAMVRKSFSGRQLDMGQALGLMEAIEMVTLSSAFAAGMDDIVGSLAPGKFADFVILNCDLEAVPAEQITSSVFVTSTWLNGVEVFARDS